MSTPFYAKSPGNEGYIKNMEVVAFHDLNGIMAFQTAMYKTAGGKYYIYCGSFKGAGCNILDVTDPTKPALVNFMEVCDPKVYIAQSTPKVQVADDLLLVALGGGIPYLHGISYEDKNMGGLQIYSLKEDPEHPKLLSYWETGVPDGMGVHRFMYNGGRYVHLSADCQGYIGQIYRILDIEDPANPVEVGRWWMPEQFSDGMEVGTYPVGHRDEKDWPQLHGPPYVQDGIAYIGYWAGGAILVDVNDVTKPKKLGQLKVTPPFSGKLAGARSHTMLPLSGTKNGRKFAVLSNEGERFASWSKEIIENSGKLGGAQPLNSLLMIDVTDPGDPVLVADFPYPEVPKDFPWPNFNDCGLGCQGPFGPHNLHEPMGKPWLEDNPDRVYNCYFHAGMRVYDVSDPYYIKEIAYFIPPNPEHKYFEVNMPGPLLGTAEDCIVDERGYIYMNCFHDGMYILRLTENQ